jgi:hypothetical protein
MCKEKKCLSVIKHISSASRVKIVEKVKLIMAILVGDIRLLLKKMNISISHITKSYGVSASRVNAALKRDYNDSEFPNILNNLLHNVLWKLRENEILQCQCHDSKSDELEVQEKSLKAVDRKISELNKKIATLKLELTKLRIEKEQMALNISIIENDMREKVVGNVFDIETDHILNFNGSGSGFSPICRVSQGHFKIILSEFPMPSSFQIFVEYLFSWDDHDKEYLHLEPIDTRNSYHTVPYNKDLVFYVFATEGMEWNVSIECLSEEENREVLRKEFVRIGLINDLDLSGTSKEYLLRFDIKSIHQLISLTRSEIVLKLGLGSGIVENAILQEIEHALDKRHLSFYSEIVRQSEIKSLDSEMYSHNPKQNQEENIMNITIEEMNLSNRTYNCLKRGGLNTIAEVANKTEDDLFRIRNMGRKCIEEVQEKLEEYGVTIRCS